MVSSLRLLLLFIFGLSSGMLAAQHYDSGVTVAGAMRNVMWDGKLSAIIAMDSIGNQTGLYGIGPVSYLRGEILINNGKTYVSRVNDDNSMHVEITTDVGAPFFVYGVVNDWQETPLPQDVTDIASLERFLDEQTREHKRPFVFKLTGKIDEALIHVQNLPEGTSVSSPDEAHQGQVKFNISDVEVEIIGFFSTRHQGIFTHHDTYLHMHLVTSDEEMMGHLDSVKFRSNRVQLHLPGK